MGGDAIAGRTEILFQPTRIGNLRLANRIVMAPMTRCMSPGGVPGEDVARYYRRRAEGGVGLIVTEGTWIPHPSASNEENAPRFYGEDALAGWKRVAEEVHAAGGRIMPQLWHIGQTGKVALEGLYSESYDHDDRQLGPSGLVGSLGVPPRPLGRPATQREIDEVTDAYATAAASAAALGFDGVELHGAHGYLFDQFFWSATNLRSDCYGGDLRQRTRFAVEVIREIKRRTGPDFPLVFRMSQWKLQDYRARLADTPDELAALLEPLVDAGVDAFHCSQRRFWEGEFDSDLNLAGWVRKIGGKPTISVGSVTLRQDLMETIRGASSEYDENLPKLFDMMERGDFDMIAVGRALIMDAQWPAKVRRNAMDEILPYTPEALGSLA